MYKERLDRYDRETCTCEILIYDSRDKDMMEMRSIKKEKVGCDVFVEILPGRKIDKFQRYFVLFKLYLGKNTVIVGVETGWGWKFIYFWLAGNIKHIADLNLNQISCNWIDGAFSL